MSKASDTRQMILQKAFALIYTQGYQSTSVDDIIATTKVTKGAFFYHFKSKDAMGLAIIKEILKPTMTKAFIEPLQESKDPVKEIYAITKYLLLDHPFLKAEYGCPAGNLTQEMAPWNKAFSKALAELILAWQHTIETVITKGKTAGKIRKEVHATSVATFIISGYWGVRNLGKLTDSTPAYQAYLKGLKQFLESLQ